MQSQLGEAMAIVVAPTDPRTKQKIFRLTTPGGLDLVAKCTQTGFHAHSAPFNGQEIYELCGHVYLDETAHFDCADLR
jgi:STAM-binding protein